MLTAYWSKKIGVGLIIAIMMICLILSDLSQDIFNITKGQIIGLTMIVFIILITIEAGKNLNIPLFPIFFIVPFLYEMDNFLKMSIDVWKYPFLAIILSLVVISVDKEEASERYLDNGIIAFLFAYLIYDLGKEPWIFLLTLVLAIQVNLNSRLNKYTIGTVGFFVYIGLS